MFMNSYWQKKDAVMDNRSKLNKPHNPKGRFLATRRAIWVAALLVACFCNIASAAKAQNPPEKTPAVKTENQADRNRHLSVPLASSQIVDEHLRPDWVEKAPRTILGRHTIWVAGDPGANKAEAKRLLEEAFVQRIQDYNVEKIGEHDATDFLSRKEVLRDLVAKEQYTEQIESPTFGTLFVSHGMLSLGSSYQGKLQEFQQQSILHSRIRMTTLAVGSLFAMMSFCVLVLVRRRKPVAPDTPWGATIQTKTAAAAPQPPRAATSPLSSGIMAVLLLLVLMFAGGVIIVTLFLGVGFTQRVKYISDDSAPSISTDVRMIDSLNDERANELLVKQAESTLDESHAEPDETSSSSADASAKKESQ